MKKVILILVALGLLIVIGIGGVLFYAVSNANALAQKYKPEMEKAASDALGSTVTFGGVSASVFPTARVVLETISVASEEESLTLDRVDLEVALLPLLSSRLEVRNFVIDRPSITVYLEEDGIFIAGLPRDAGAESEPEPAPETGGPASEFAVALDRFALNNASLRVINRVAEQEYLIDNVDVSARMGFANQRADLSNLQGSARLLEKMNLKLDGKAIAYELVGGAVQVDGLELDVDGNRLNVAGALDPNDRAKELVLKGENIRPASFGPLYDLFAPSFNDMDLKGAASSEIRVAWDPNAAYVISGVLNLEGMGATVGGMTVSELSGPLNIAADADGMDANTDALNGKLADAAFTIKTAASLKKADAKLEPLTIDIFGGRLDSRGAMTLDDNMPFEASINVANMQFEPMIATLLPETPQTVSGTLTKVDGSMTGTLDDNLMPSLVGNVDMLLSDGLIKEVNLGKQVLGAVGDIPFLADTLLAAVPERYRPFLQADQTVLKSVSGAFDVAEEKMTTENLQIVSDFFTMDAKGVIGFDSNVDLDTTIHFTPEFSAALAESTRELRVLFDDQGRLSFPVVVRGVPPDLTVLPDVKGLMQGAVRGTVEEAARGLLEGVTGPREETEGTEEETTSPVGGLINRLRPRSNNP